MFAILSKFHALRYWLLLFLPTFFPLPPFFLRCAFAHKPQTYPAAFILLNYRGLRFSDLVFVGYTADGYKKGLCHETPTAEELAGVDDRNHLQTSYQF